MLQLEAKPALRSVASESKRRLLNDRPTPTREELSLRFSRRTVTILATEEYI